MGRGRGLGWTAAQTADALRLHASGAGWDEIAAATGRSVGSCRSKLGHPSRLPEPAHAALLRLREVKRPRWTRETEAELIRLRDVDGLSWFDIDGHFNRMHGSCSHKYNELKQGIVRDKKPPGRKPSAIRPESASRIAHPQWTDADMAHAEKRWRELFVDVWGTSAPRHERHLIFEVIGRKLGRTASAVEHRLRYFGASFGLYAASKPLTQPVEVSQAMLDARERNAARLRQDPCSALMGDPPPGFSALDQIMKREMTT